MEAASNSESLVSAPFSGANQIFSNVATYDSISKAPTYNSNEEERKEARGGMTFAQLLAKKLGIQGGEKEDDVLTNFMEGFTVADNA